MQRLGHDFHQPELLTRALTHRGFGDADNERLEFLGDAVLGYVVADWLHEHRPSESEAALTLLRAALVRRETLAAVARELRLAEHLRLGASERRSGGRGRDSLLADAFEAIIGAIHVDGGIEPARDFVLRCLAERAAALDAEALKDPKTRLQEHLQRLGRPLPSYRIEDQQGPDHARTFLVSCRLEDAAEETRGEASSRRQAEKAAAAAMLARLEGHHDE